MQDWPDVRLLRAYAGHGSETAFREIVLRHTGLVYSSALRQVRDPDLAQDLSQMVFADLARKAESISKGLAEEASLAGWLYSGVRLAALNHFRADQRRLAREKEVMLEFNDAPDSADWNQLAPLLDSAMAELPDLDREALILRFFENAGFRTIAANLGISDDAAQKRVSRALDRLRADFARRGLAVTSTALASAISLNAAVAAPAGLAETLSVLAFSSAAAGKTVALAAVKTIVMTTFQKSLIGAAALLAVSVGTYEATQASRLKSEVSDLRKKIGDADKPVGQLRQDLQNALARAAALEQENSLLKREAKDLPRLRGELASARRDLISLSDAASQKSDPFVQEALRWKAGVARLHQLFEDRPDQRIPELQLADSDTWLGVAKGADFDSETGVRKALAAIRKSARNIFVASLSEALMKYVAKNDGRLPNDMGDLKPYFEKPVQDEMLQQYGLAYTGSISNMPSGTYYVITNQVADPEFDAHWGVGPGRYGLMPRSPERFQPLLETLGPALKAFSASNNGRNPAGFSDLRSYVKTTAERDALEQLEALQKAHSQ